MVFWTPTDFFSIVVEEIDLLIGVSKTKIVDLNEVAVESIAVYYVRFCCSIKHHVNTDRLPVRLKGTIPDESIVFALLR